MSPEQIHAAVDAQRERLVAEGRTDEQIASYLQAMEAVLSAPEDPNPAWEKTFRELTRAAPEAPTPDTEHPNSTSRLT